MALTMHSIVFFAVVITGTFWGAESIEYIISHSVWEGVSLYIPTSRDLIQDKLDDWYELNSKAEDGPRLYLPDKPILKGLGHDQHVIYIDFGPEIFEEFERSEEAVPDSQLNTTVPPLLITIPFLSGTPGGKPLYSLAVAALYDKDLGKFPTASAAYPYLPVDEITLHGYHSDGGELVVINGSEEIRMTFREKRPCAPPEPIVEDEFYEFIFGARQVPYDGPQGFDFCDTYPRQNDYCDEVAQIRDDAYSYSPDICQIWYVTDDLFDCSIRFDQVQISPGFFDYIPIAHGENVRVMASQKSKMDIGTILKFPCFP